ncbi:hypothetical protein MTO96_040139 [Rhipicephalus appendiculatus]
MYIPLSTAIIHNMETGDDLSEPLGNEANLQLPTDFKGLQVPSRTPVLPMRTQHQQLDRLRQLHLLRKALRNPVNQH